MPCPEATGIPGPRPRRVRPTAIAVTRSGEHVLEGRADRVALLGLDRWVGGTHLTAGTAWRWDPAAMQLVRPGRGRGEISAWPP
jgi:hypothetical protein